MLLGLEAQPSPAEATQLAAQRPGPPLPETPNDDGVDCPEQPKFCPADEFLVSWQPVINL
ncbi:hypothetical protein MY4824_009233 [Beauveria thailandica]